MTEPQRQSNKRKRADVIFVRETRASRSSAAQQEATESPEPATATDLKAAEQRYRAWRRNGSMHSGACFQCDGEDGLLDCQTCRRSYHRSCLAPPLSRFFHDGNFFCKLCVDRRWHRKAPPVSPPPTPPPPRAPVVRIPDHGDGLPETSSSTTTVSLPSAATVSTPRSQPPQGPVVPLSQTGDAPVRPEIRRESAIPSLTTQSPRRNPLPAPAATDVPRLGPPLPPLPSLPSATATKPPRSRFSTISPEADDAISLILRELEYLAEARQRISQLERLVLKQRQDVQISENARRIAESNAAADHQQNFQKLRDENGRLKSQAESLGRTLREMEARSEGYKAELASRKTELDLKTAEAKKCKVELEELKGKLKGLLG